MEMGLLLPDGSKAQYQFEEREKKDMETILKLKKRKFSLPEIRQYLDIERISTEMEVEKTQELKLLLQQKKGELEKEQEELKGICRTLDQDIVELNRETEKLHKKSGVPLSFLPLLSCPKCGNSLRLRDAELDSLHVYTGNLCCECGYHAVIDDGIIDTGIRYTGKHDSPDLHREIYRGINPNFVVQLQKCFDYGKMLLQKLDLNKKVILEGHINAYFFLYKNLKYLPRDCIYIITDKYKEVVKIYKERISRMYPEYNILYIADASVDLPIKSHCVDVLIDFMGDNEHGLYHKNFYIDDLKRFLAESAIIIGGAQGYHREARSLAVLEREYPEGNLSGSKWDELDEYYKKAGYERVLHPIGAMSEIAKKGAYRCHQKGEELLIGGFYAVPLSKK